MNIFKCIHETNKIIYTKEQRKWMYIYTVLCVVAEGFGMYAIVQLFKRK